MNSHSPRAVTLLNILNEQSFFHAQFQLYKLYIQDIVLGLLDFYYNSTLKARRPNTIFVA